MIYKRFIQKILASFKALNLQEQFNPSFLSIFYNANYFVKKGVYQGIERYSSTLQGRLLDIGCGNKPYKNLFNVKEYIGIDIENEAHNHESEMIDIIFDGKKIPFKDNSFDCVFSSEVFEHVFYLEELIKESNRILRVGGNILITLPFVWIEHEKPNDFARYTTFGIRDLLERNNFTVLHMDKSSTYLESIFQLIAVYVYQKIEC